MPPGGADILHLLTLAVVSLHVIQLTMDLVTKDMESNVLHLVPPGWGRRIRLPMAIGFTMRQRRAATTTGENASGTALASRCTPYFRSNPPGRTRPPPWVKMRRSG